MMGLTKRQAEAFRIVTAEPKISVRELSRRLGSSNPSLGQWMLKSLRERGLIAHRRPAMFAAMPPERFGTDPSAGRPAPYTGAYPIHEARTCADLIAEGVL